MELERVHRQQLKRRTLYSRSRTDEAFRDDFFVKTKYLKELGALV